MSRLQYHGRFFHTFHVHVHESGWDLASPLALPVQLSSGKHACTMQEQVLSKSIECERGSNPVRQIDVRSRVKCSQAKRTKGPPCAVGRGSDGIQTAFSTDHQDVINSVLQSSPT